MLKKILKPDNYICSLDIGSSKISACVAKIKKDSITGIFFDSIPSKGISRGVIIDAIVLVGSIGKLLKNLRVKSGVNIKFIYANISGSDIVTKHSRAIIPLAERGNKVITLSDIQRVNEQARILGSGLEEEIIHLIPLSYTIDSKNNVVNPIGLYSHRLEVDLYLVCAKLSSVQSLNRAINQSGYEIKDLLFSGLATSRAVLSQELRQGLNLFCDIGSDTTELLIFRNGKLCDIEILNIGGDDLTRQLQEALKIPFDLAEDIKRSHAIIGAPEQIGEDKEILIKKSNLYKPIKQRLVSEIISSAAKLVCSNIKDAVEKKVSTYEVDNFVIVGRTILLEGFIETLENTLSIPVKLGRIANQNIPAFVREDGVLSGHKFLTYITCLGMVSQAMQEKSAEMGIEPVNKPPKNPILKAVNRFKDLYQEYF
jgi:cell division protein FtsA